jgi:hypothetical protein
MTVLRFIYMSSGTEPSAVTAGVVGSLTAPAATAEECLLGCVRSKELGWLFLDAAAQYG